VGFLHVAVVGEDPQPVLASVRELGAEAVVCIGTEADEDDASELRAQLAQLDQDLDTEWRPIPGDRLLGTIQLVQRIATEHGDRREDLLVNLCGADKGGACAGLSGAFVAGVKAVDRPGDEVVFLPVLRFRYDDVVSDAKLDLLTTLDERGGEVDRLRALAEAAGVQDSLASYHIRGGRDGKGLTELGLVEVDRGARGALTIRLTSMGQLMARSLAVEA